MLKQGVNPYLPSWEYIPDAEPHVFGDRVYIYGSHDRFNGHVYCLNDYVCWSAPVDDLGDWRYEGDRKSTRLNSSHVAISYAVFCLKKKIVSWYGICVCINGF